MNEIFEFAQNVSLKYFLYLPDDYEKEEKLPLIVFLHGAGERGDDLEILKKQAFPRYISEGKKYPAVILCPQCPDGIIWNDIAFAVKALIDKIADEYKIDKNRISLTGLSMGGYGTWAVGMLFPEMFSAMAPICGGGIVWHADTLKNIPIRAFHGSLDTTVQPQCSLEMVNAVNRSGGRAEFTLFPDADHNSWDPAYLTTDVIEWLIKSEKKN